MEFTTRFRWKTRGCKDPFNGEYIKALNRVPNIGEHISFTGHPTPYKVVDVITELKGWETYYTIVLDINRG